MLHGDQWHLGHIMKRTEERLVGIEWRTEWAQSSCAVALACCLPIKWLVAMRCLARVMCTRAVRVSGWDRSSDRPAASPTWTLFDVHAPAPHPTTKSSGWVGDIVLGAPRISIGFERVGGLQRKQALWAAKPSACTSPDCCCRTRLSLLGLPACSWFLIP